LNGGIVVDNDNENFESDAEQGHLDFALRYSHTIGDWSVGLSWFNGTSREADLTRFSSSAQTYKSPPVLGYLNLKQFNAIMTMPF